MRRYDEPIEVKAGLVAGEEGPAHFLWRNRIWSVRAIESRWLETGAWWDGPAARAVRGEAADDRHDGRPEHQHADQRDDPSAEHEIWRVLAAPGRSAEHGVCELTYAASTGSWRLRTLMD